MNVMTQIITTILIAAGAMVMGYAVYSVRRLFALLENNQHQQQWRILSWLMRFFALGYVVAIAFVWLDLTAVLLTVTGVIFLFGALFVLLVVRTGLGTITELLATQHSLEQARDAAVAAERLKGELLARMTHELRTPLNAILGYADMLQSGIYGALGEKQVGYVERIMANAQRLIEHISNLLRQSRLEAEGLRYEIRPFSVKELADYVLQIGEATALEKGIQLLVDVQPSLPAHVESDKALLQEILTNLVGNALKFTEKGKIAVTFYQPDSEQWAIDVTDTGEGIHPEAQALIFEPFRQLDGSITREHGGVGLGLSIVDKITAVLGGTLTLKSDVGQGSTFTIRLPHQPLAELEGEFV